MWYGCGEFWTTASAPVRWLDPWTHVLQTAEYMTKESADGEFFVSMLFSRCTHTHTHTYTKAILINDSLWFAKASNICKCTSLLPWRYGGVFQCTFFVTGTHLALRYELRYLPESPMYLFTKDPVAFKLFFNQICRRYLLGELYHACFWLKFYSHEMNDRTIELPRVTVHGPWRQLRHVDLRLDVCWLYAV